MASELVSRVKRRLCALHRDDQGAEMVEYMLIVAAVALPLMAVVIWFWKDIARWVGETWKEIKEPGYEGTEPDDL